MNDMNKKREGKVLFRGYSSPNYTPVPDELFDEQLPDVSGAELKVLLYVIRRTFGFKRESDNISLSQMLNGLRTRDGRVLDRGVGLSKKTLLQAIKSLEEQNIILTQRRRSQEKGDEPTSYRLHVRSATAVEVSTPPVGEKLHHGGGGRTAPPPWGENPPTQETVVGETDLDLSKFEGSHDQVEGTRQIPNTTRQSQLTAAVLNGSAALAGFPRTSDRGSTAGPASLKDLIARRRLSSGGPRRGRPAGNSEDRERLRPFLEDFARELGDEAPLSSTITRALTIFKTAAVPPERWGDVLYQARGLTQEHTAQIRKTANTSGDQFRRKNKMPYFLATLEQLVGSRPDSSDPSPER
jgi:hypothetical protein